MDTTTKGNSTLQNVLFNEIRHDRIFLPSEQLSIRQCIGNKFNLGFDISDRIWFDYHNKTGIFKDFDIKSFHEQKI